MWGDALQTSINITNPNRENLGEILTVFRRKYVKPQSMAAAKHKFQRLVFNPANQNLIDFLDELQKLAKDAFGVAAQAIIEQFIYAKKPPHLKKSFKPGAFGEWHIWTDCVASWKGVGTEWFGSPRWNANKHCDATSPTAKLWKAQTNVLPLQKNQVTIKISAVNSNEKKAKPETIRIVQTKTMVVPNKTLTPTTKFQTIPQRTIQRIKETEDLDLSSHPVRPVVELTTPQRKATLEQTEQTDRLPESKTGRTKPSPTGKCSKRLRWERPSCSPNFKLATPRLHSGAALTDRRQLKYQNFHQFPRLCGSNLRKSPQIKIT